jgi:kynureninase
MIDPAALAAHYSRFRVTERVLLTGHSHQAWPDVAFEGQQESWLDAAALVDDKWGRAMEVAEDVAAGWRLLLTEPDAVLALGQNTHDLLVRLLSALLPARTRLVTTDGEFHTIRRQLDRLAEEGVEVVKVSARPSETLAERLAGATTARTAAVLVSSVLFETAELVPGLDDLARACQRHGAALVVDAYHHLNAVPFAVDALGLSDAFILGGGYKYCQLGEGNCFLRVPPDTTLRPVITGWYSEFAELAEAKQPGEVRYGKAAARFAGATYDPASHYRARAVFRFFGEQRLTPERLRALNVQQVGMLERAFEALDLEPAAARIVVTNPDRRAGFLAVQTPRASELVGALRERDVYADARGDYLRLGPAPYVTEGQLRDAVAALGEALQRPPR